MHFGYRTRGSQSVLLLNVNGEVLNIVSANRALKLFTMEKAVIVKEKEDSTPIHPTFGDVKHPSVLQLMYYVQRDRLGSRVPLNRRNVFVRDNWTCQYCGRQLNATTATIDHVHPKSKVGKKLDWENAVAACQKCNSKKSDCTLAEVREQYGMELKRKPFKPNWGEFLVTGHPNRPEWKEFVRTHKSITTSQG